MKIPGRQASQYPASVRGGAPQEEEGTAGRASREASTVGAEGGTLRVLGTAPLGPALPCEVADPVSTTSSTSMRSGKAPSGARRGTEPVAEAGFAVIAGGVGRVVDEEGSG